MRSTRGLALLANGVIRKYGMTLRAPSNDQNSSFVYFSANKETGMVNVLSHKDESKKTGYKSNYLYDMGDVSPLNFRFFEYGGLVDSHVIVCHPKENEAVSEINRLSKEFGEIRLPPELAKKLKNDEPKFERYEPLDNWALNFVNNYSEYLHKAKI